MGSLDRIRIKGFKSIREMDLELNKLNVLIGANGSGKSNFIKVFTLLNQILNGNLQNYVARSGGADRLLYYGQKTTQEIELRSTFGQNGYDVRLGATADDNLYFGREQIWYHDYHRYTQPLRITLGSGHQETELFEESRKYNHRVIADYVIENIKSWKLYQFHDTSDTARVKLTSDIGDNQFLRPDAANLAAYLYRLQETEYDYYSRIVRTIRKVTPFFDDFDLHPSALNPGKIQLEWREIDSDQYFNASMLSDGTLRFMSLATLLLQPEADLPDTILIDEPELGLHPFAITMLAGLLRSAATKTQVIVATQSVPLVNQFIPEDIIVVDRIDGQSTFTRLREASIESWLKSTDEQGMGYSVGDLWEKNVIGGRPQP